MTNFDELKNMEGVRFYEMPCDPFAVNGFVEAPFHRLPTHVAEQVSEGVKELHTNTAGGRIRFRTDSRTVRLLCEYPHLSCGNNFCRIGNCCFDLYCDGEYHGPFLPEDGYMPDTAEPSAYRMERLVGDRKMREIVIHFPSYSDVTRVAIGLDEDAALLPPTPYRDGKPVCYYGSSITQGGCASHNGNSYQNMICRKLNVDYVNLGFSGNCKAEPVMAEYIAGQEMSVFVYDYDHNAPDVAHLEQTHEALFRTFREKQPHTPVVMISVSDNALPDIMERRAVIRKTYENALAAGDQNVYFIDGREMYREVGLQYCTVDGCHPNDLGFYMMAKKIGAVLAQILEKREEK